MNVLIAGGRGFLGSALQRSLRTAGHEVVVLTRRPRAGEAEIEWDGRSPGAWVDILPEMHAVVHACGYGLEHWPWTPGRKQRFVSSRVDPGLVLASAIANAPKGPAIFIQFSGVNYYGLAGSLPANEETPPATDFLARLAVAWEAATKPLDAIGVRRVVVRNAVVLHPREGLFPLMCMAPRVFAGGRLGSGTQAMPWIHIADHVRALRFLMENQEAQGVYNLVAPAATSNASFLGAVCRRLGRPYWLHAPDAAMRLVLGEMGSLVLNGRYAEPRRLIQAGFRFEFETLDAALQDLL